MPGTGLPDAGHVFKVTLAHLQRGTIVPKRLGRAALAGIVLLSLANRAGVAQASAAIQASVTVVDPAASAFPMATVQLSLDPHLSPRQTLRRDLRGATLLVEIPPRLSTAPGRRVTIIHW
jgi:hypothetical protein